KSEAIELVLDTVEALFQERDGNLWGSMVKQTLKRKRPNFDESFYGFRAFSDLLKEAAKQGLLELERDQKSGGYLIQGFGPKA
ncbi:MAG: OST-HTH/LOTUS domain-containing protein, partial [Myxococcales bacterium]|nr:OST-HTH/LOTUS domain-containing protein [Myxococcales bacterium]